MGFIGFVVGDPMGVENRLLLLSRDNGRGKVCWYLPGRNQHNPTTEEDGDRCNS
jgi:hypothetical protein